MDVKPIHSDADHAAALDEVDRLWGAAPGTAEGDKLDVLVILVEDYEAKRWPIDAPDPIALIEFFMAETGRSQADLGRLLGSRSRASEVMNRKRPLTLAMIHRLNESWGLPADILVRPYETGGSGSSGRG